MRMSTSVTNLSIRTTWENGSWETTYFVYLVQTSAVSENSTSSNLVQSSVQGSPRKVANEFSRESIGDDDRDTGPKSRAQQ